MLNLPTLSKFSKPSKEVNASKEEELLPLEEYALTVSLPPILFNLLKPRKEVNDFNVRAK